MDANVGDRIVVESERAGQSGQAGVIEEVLSQDPQRFRVLWDDGHTSIFAPLGWCREDRGAQERARKSLTRIGLEEGSDGEDLGSVQARRGVRPSPNARRSL